MKKMKKALASLLAATMVMSMSVTAWADNEVVPDASEKESVLIKYVDANKVALIKNYELTNVGTTSPAETFKFGELECISVKDALANVTTDTAPKPTLGEVAYLEGDAGSANKTKAIIIDLPEYESVGIYTYTFKEIDNNVAGVSYRQEPIKLVVTVVQQEGQEGKTRVAAVHTENLNDGNKTNDFDNVYSAGSLSVKKNVTGLLGSHEEEFTVRVSFQVLGLDDDIDTVKSAITYTDGTEEKTIKPEDWKDNQVSVEINLVHDETVTFENIPYNVNYIVEEYNYTTDGYGYDAPTFTIDGVENTNVFTSYDKNGFAIGSAITDSLEEVVITNNKGGNVDTGILLDSAPYILLLALAGVGAFAVATKKREEEF